MMLLNMSDSPQVSMWCTLIRNKVISLFFFEVPLSDWWHCLLLQRTFFQSNGAPSRFSHHVCASLDREFPDC